MNRSTLERGGASFQKPNWSRSAHPKAATTAAKTDSPIFGKENAGPMKQRAVRSRQRCASGGDGGNPVRLPETNIGAKDRDAIMPKPRSSVQRIVLGTLFMAGIPACQIDPPTSSPSPSGTPEFLGSTTCAACHPSLGALHAVHGHANALTLIEGEGPGFPETDPPQAPLEAPGGLGWENLSYLVGGYKLAGRAVDRDGFLLIDGSTGEYLQSNRSHPVTGTLAGLVSFDIDNVIGQPFTIACFRCHTTGAASFDGNGGIRQGGRIGIEGTWAEGGVGCEACHGPGSLHIPAPEQGNITVDSSAQACGTCHTHDDRPDEIQVEKGFLLGNQQFAEVLASPHADFDCTVCHDPHRSVIHDRDLAIRNECQTCHPERDTASHEGKIFSQDDYAEALTCMSCHMSLAGRSAISADAERTANNGGRIGDTRTHIIWINTDPVGLDDILGAEDGIWPTDSEGKAAITLDFICLRCHTGLGNAFKLELAGAAAIAPGLHGTTE